MEPRPGFTGPRKAFIQAINGDGSYDIYYADDNSNNVIKNVNTISMGSFGSGIFNRYHEGAPVWVLQSYYYQPVIVGFANSPGSIENAPVIDANDIETPFVNSGEIVIQSSSGAHIDLRQTGDIKVSNLHNDSIVLSDTNRAIITNAYQHYNINDGGFIIEGRVRRFHPSYLPGQSVSPVFVDLLNDPEADTFTVDIARDPSQKALPMNRARGTTNVIRNPSFAEKREIVLEFADSFFVRDSNTESKLASEFPKTLQEMDRSIAKRRGYGDKEQTFDNFRHSSRTNLLKLDSNVVIERVQGTLVDIFGNVLDINYNKLDLPKLSDKGVSAIEESHSLLARSVAYHFMVNSRNIITEDNTGNGRFTFDIDKEGQFKLNIPRSSTKGNISTLSSFINNDSDIDSRIDIVSTQLSQSNIPTPNGGIAGTAFHDMTLTAERLIQRSIKAINLIREHSNTTGVQTNGDTPNIEFLITDSTTSDKIPQNTTTISVQAESGAISNTIDPNFAGGRSGQINMEGSLEMSVGKDEVDGKSLLLDTDGSIVSWIGQDTHGRSAVVDMDGSFLLNIGHPTVDSNSNKVINQGILSIRINLINEENPKLQLQTETPADNKTTSDIIFYLGPKGIVLSSGNGTPISIRSSGNLMLEAAGTVDIKGKEIRMDAGYLRKIKASKGDI